MPGTQFGTSDIYRIEFVMQPLVHEVGESRNEVPVSDVRVGNHCLDAHHMCGIVRWVTHQTMELGSIVVGRGHHPEESGCSLLLQQAL